MRAEPKFEMPAIKVVIWDLDDTFWQGTLSEEGIVYSRVNHEIVVELARRGIVSSICSKNDCDQVTSVLSKHEIWNYFVFAKINWQPKGQAVAQILDEMGLRPTNALFIDDNHQNREEVKFSLPGINVADPTILKDLLSHPSCRGKEDSSLVRLRQYQLLERKERDSKRFTSNHTDFLKQCDIRVSIDHDCLPKLDRIAELIERTNQLNFTKKRIDRGSVQKLITDSDAECGIVEVSDRYGDYGVCGFFAIRNRRLEHFLFSCRILNMGVESWVYHQLQRPNLTVSGEVASHVDSVTCPTWISSGASISRISSALNRPSAKRVLLKGGCDMEPVLHFLGDVSVFHGELNYVAENGAPVHREHTELLRIARSGLDEQVSTIIDRLPFLDRNAFSTSLFDRSWNVIVYSPLMDFTQGVYRHGSTGHRVTVGDFLVDLTNKCNWNTAFLSYHFSRSEIEWFSDNFVFEGCTSEARFEENLRWLCREIGDRTSLILLNGAEIESDNVGDGQRVEHHKRMNSVIDKVVSSEPNVLLCDVRKYIRNSADLTNSLRHYRRHVHFRIAVEIRDLLARSFAYRRNRFAEAYFAVRAIARYALRLALWRLAGLRGKSRVRSVENEDAESNLAT